MRKILTIVLINFISFMASSHTKVLLTVGETTLTATLVDNAATSELKNLLNEGDVTIRMSDYGGFEKVGALPRALTTSNSQITTAAGDIMLYQGINMVIFYGSNSWSYTRLGKIEGVSGSELKKILGSGDISLTISLDATTGIEDVSSEENGGKVAYDLNGTRITAFPLSPGIYIVNGKKTVVR